MSTPPLYSYQREGIEALVQILTSREERTAMLCDPPGAGKTPQAIGVCNQLECASIIIVCPASLKHTWEREVKRWTPEGQTPRPVTVLNAIVDYMRITYMPPKNIGVLIMSYALARRVSQTLRGAWDMLICDEAHLCKNPSSKTTKAVLMSIHNKCNYRLFLTGTPMPNGKAIELFPLFSRCCKKQFGDWKEFKKRYLKEEKTPWGVVYHNTRNVVELKRLSQEFIVRRTKDDVLGNLPGLIRQNVYVTIPKQQAFDIEQGIDVEAIVAAVEAGAILDSDHIMTVRRKLAIAKAPLILEHIKDTLQEVAQVVVFVHHRELYTYLLGNLSKVVGINGLTSTKDRQYHVDTFQSGEAEVLVCSLRAANTGLTLTAAYTMIMGEYDWVPSTNEQAEGRIYRVTQKEICRVKYIVAAETIDERVLNVVQRKQKEISRLVD